MFIWYKLHNIIQMLSHLKDVIVLTGLNITQAHFRLLHKKTPTISEKKNKRTEIMPFTLNSLDLTFLCVPCSSRDDVIVLVLHQQQHSVFISKFFRMIFSHEKQISTQHKEQLNRIFLMQKYNRLVCFKGQHLSKHTVVLIYFHHSNNFLNYLLFNYIERDHYIACSRFQTSIIILPAN